MSRSDLVIIICLVVFSAFGVFYSAKGLNDLRKSEISLRFTAGGLIGAKIYYSIGFVAGLFMFLFLTFKLISYFATDL